MFTLSAKTRTIKGKKVARLRKEGLVPAVCYGAGKVAQALSLNLADFEKVYEEAGESSLVDLIIDKAGPVKVLIYDLQRDPETDKIIHVDFYRIKAGEKITIEIALKFIGESQAEKVGGSLVANIDRIEVECLPKDLVGEIEVDISRLETFDDVIRVKDLKVPQGLEVKVNPDEVVVMVEPPRKEEEVKEELEVKPEEKVEKVEKVEKEKKEKREGVGAPEEKKEV